MEPEGERGVRPTRRRGVQIYDFSRGRMSNRGNRSAVSWIRVQQDSVQTPPESYRKYEAKTHGFTVVAEVGKGQSRLILLRALNCVHSVYGILSRIRSIGERLSHSFQQLLFSRGMKPTTGNQTMLQWQADSQAFKKYQCYI